MTTTKQPALPELLPCPFCGGAPRLVDYAGWEVLCKCGVNFTPGEQDPTIENTAAAWNTRPPPNKTLDRQSQT